jgi:hypothetical protein
MRRAKPSTTGRGTAAGISRSRLPLASAADGPAAVPSPARSKPKKTTPRSRALSAEALAQLGASRLAELLMAQAKGDAALARTLRLALAGTDGSGRLAAEVEKRLRTIGALAGVHRVGQGAPPCPRARQPPRYARRAPRRNGPARR